MITSGVSPFQAISPTPYYSADSKRLDSNPQMDHGDDQKMSKGEISKRSDQVHSSNVHSTNFYAAPHSSDNDYAHNINIPSGNKRADTNNMSLGGDQNEMNRQGTTRQEEQHDDGGESREIQRSSLKEPLHKTLYDNFHSDLTSLREATIEALQLSCQEQERLCLKGEELEARIAYMKKKIVLARDELLSKGVLGGDMDDDVRLSLVKEGGDETSSQYELGTLDEGGGTENRVNPTPPTNRFSSSREGLHGSFVSKRFSMRSSLHSSQTTQLSKGSSAGESHESHASMPHMSRSSILSMLGASKTWLDHYANGSSNENDESTGGSTTSFRISFMEGAGDGMPSRWRAREQEREKTEKQKEEEKKRLQKKALGDEMDGVGMNSTTLPKKEKSKEEKLKDLITEREEEIATLEKRTFTVDQEASSLREGISTLEIDHQQEQGEFERERRELLAEIGQVESDNENMDYMLVETGVSLDEEKIIIEILADELKGAREQLARLQYERDVQRSERRRKERSRRVSGWMRNSVSSLFGLETGEEGKQDEQQPQKSQSAQGQSQGKVARYQVPSDAMQHYQTLVNSSDDDTSAENLDQERDQSGSGSGDNQGLDRRRSYASEGTCMSSLTLDSCDLVDILEQLELDE